MGMTPLYGYMKIISYGGIIVEFFKDFYSGWLCAIISVSLTVINRDLTQSVFRGRISEFEDVLIMTKKISITGIATCILYFISVGVFLIAKAGIALTAWELMTILSAPVVLFVLSELSTLNDIRCRNFQ